MKIQNTYNNGTYYKPTVNIRQKQTNPSFGIRFRPKELKDIFLKLNSNSDSIKRIKNVEPGLYGTKCSGSKPLQDFWDEVSEEDYEQLCARGISTNVGGWADCILKSKLDNPLSTSGVFDCSVLYLFNKEANTHLLYHSYYNAPEKYLKILIETFMNEGFSGAAIVPGDKYWYKRHDYTLKTMLSVLKNINNSAKINVYHETTQYPEIVGYNGNMFEITNNQFTHYSNKGQASFKISNLRVLDMFDQIEWECTSPESVKLLRKEFEEKGYDKEILKVINNILDEKSKNCK